MTEQKKVAIVFGYGLAVADVFTERLVGTGYSVAIVARNEARLRESAAKYGPGVEAFPFDLSESAEIPGLLERITAQLGPIDLVLYNATIALPSYTQPVVAVQKAIAVNITSVHVTFGWLLPHFQARGSGTFLLSGGGFAENGAWSVGVGFQFGAPSKAYYKNFAQVVLMCLAIFHV
jgi:3-oxoacyl-[acyl-carrier protein] reductase